MAILLSDVRERTARAVWWYRAYERFLAVADKQSTTRRVTVRTKRLPAVVIVVVALAVSLLAFLGGGAISAQDAGQAKYNVRVPNGLAFSEFTGYESWQTVSISQSERLALIVANPVMINAYQSGIPANGKPFPDGAKMAKVHWNPKKLETFPTATVPGSPPRCRLHGEGQQEVRGQRRMGMGRVQV
jgi:hypothetical protein